MMNFHEDGDVETYILTIMNMVSALYRDASIGNTINVVVVRIILLEDEISQVISEPSIIPLIYGKSTPADYLILHSPRTITHTLVHSSCYNS